MMMIALAAVAALASLLLTRALRRYALARGMLDVPNRRSSHTTATPRGGGLAIVAVACVVIAGSGMAGLLPYLVVLGLLGGGIPIALIGYLDDRLGLAATQRLLVHLLASAWLVACALWLNPLLFGAGWLVPWLLAGLAVPAVAWLVNLYNFMDGIDGLAGLEALSVAAAAAALLAWQGAEDLALICIAISAASAGFLRWNWPPAQIFMGDAGSGWLGFAFGGLVLFSLATGAMPVWSWFILLGVFVVDATTTLIRRLASGERVVEAHRSHAYQRLARRFGSHRPVTLVVGAINVFWLLPLAALAVRDPASGPLLLLLAWTPILLACIAIMRSLPAD